MAKQNQIQDLERLGIENLENIFNVYQEPSGMYYYNILQTISFPQDLPISLFTSYVIKYGDTWPYISYKSFKTPNLWWLILLANNILNPIEPIVPGTEIKIPVEAVVRQVLDQVGRA